MSFWFQGGGAYDPPLEVSAPRLAASAHVFHEFGRSEVQRSGEPHDRRETRFSAAALEERHLGPVKVGGRRERLLREAAPASGRA